MKSTVHIEAFSLAAYHAIRPALVASRVGYLGVSGMVFSATINTKDYAYLVDVITHATRSAGIPASEYAITLFQTVSLPNPQNPQFPQ